ncbi:MAG: DUF5618 family protein [Bacteroidota bacterium]
MLAENKIKAQRCSDEAARYMNNAHKELQLADKNGKVYRDVKHLRVACGTAYLAVLKAMDGIFLLRNIPTPKRRASIEYYQQGLTQVDRKILTSLNVTYQILHLSGYYDGFNEIYTIKHGFEEAHYILTKLKQSI